MNTRLILAACAAIGLGACASNTVGELKGDKASADGQFQTADSYLAAYRRLRGMARECLEHSPPGAPVTTDSEIDSEMKEGEIRQKIAGNGSLLTTTVIVVTAGPNDVGNVSLYTLKGPLAIGINIPKISDIKRWAAGDKTCGVGQINRPYRG